MSARESTTRDGARGFWNIPDFFIPFKRYKEGARLPEIIAFYRIAVVHCASKLKTLRGLQAGSLRKIYDVLYYIDQTRSVINALYKALRSLVHHPKLQDTLGNLRAYIDSIQRPVNLSIDTRLALQWHFE